MAQSILTLWTLRQETMGLRRWRGRRRGRRRRGRGMRGWQCGSEKSGWRSRRR
jgi:hypothetical protein